MSVVSFIRPNKTIQVDRGDFFSGESLKSSSSKMCFEVTKALWALSGVEAPSKLSI